MKRIKLKSYTRYAFGMALLTLSIMTLFLGLYIILDADAQITLLRLSIVLTFFISFVSIPISLVSLFSIEPLSKRLFCLLVNVIPAKLLVLI